MDHGEIMIPQVSLKVELASLISTNVAHSSHADADENNDDDVTPTPSYTKNYIGGRKRWLLLALTILVFGISLVLCTTLLVDDVASTFTTVRAFGSSSSRSSSSKSIVDDDDYFSWVNSNLRWQPTRTNATHDNNCIPRFRLANSKIHCGFADISPLTTSSDGRQFCGGVPLEPSYCVLPSEGNWVAAAETTTTSLPSDEGVASTSLPPPPLPRRLGKINSINNNTSTLPRCKTMDEFTNGTYEGVGFDLEWVPTNCSSIPLSPFVWTRNTECQATITMIGDSHIRNLFTATVNGLRGVEYFAEAHADDAMKERGVAESYEWRLQHDGTATDRFAVYADTLSVDPNPFEDCPCNEAVIKCLRIAFIWAPKFQEQLDQIHFVTKWKSNIVIVEPGNAYESSVLLSPNWTAQFDQLLEADDHLRLGVLHFPWGKQPKGREAVLNSWINGAYTNRKSYALQSAMYPLGNVQGRKTFHFGCGLGKVDVVNDNIKAVEPCSDLLDTAHIRALITLHIDALSTTP